MYVPGEIAILVLLNGSNFYLLPATMDLSLNHQK